MFALKINGKTIDVDAEPDTPLLLFCATRSA
jgi:hypothetical protein